MVKIFNDKKDDLFNIGDIVSNRLQTLEAKFSSLIGPVTEFLFGIGQLSFRRGYVNLAFWDFTISDSEMHTAKFLKNIQI